MSVPCIGAAICGILYVCSDYKKQMELNNILDQSEIIAGIGAIKSDFYSQKCLFNNNILKLGVDYIRQVLGIHFNLRAQTPAAEQNGGEVEGAFVNHSGEQLFHANGTAAAPYISGYGSNILYVDHVHGFFTYGRRGLFQIQLLCNRNHKYIIILALSHSYQSFKSFIYALSQFGGNGHPVHKALAFVQKLFVGNFMFF